MQKMINGSRFGKNLRNIRKSKGLKQIDVIAQLQILGSNLNVTSYSKIEHGERNLKVTDLVGLQSIFAVDYAEFFKGITPKDK